MPYSIHFLFFLLLFSSDAPFVWGMERQGDPRQRTVLPREAFGAEAWKKYFGVEVDREPQLPNDIDAILDTRAPFSLEGELGSQYVRDNHLLTLIPREVDGDPFTLDKLGALLLENSRGHFRPFSGNRNTRMGRESHGYKYYNPRLKDEDRRSPLPCAPYWVLLPTTILADSREKDKPQHVSQVGEYSHLGYRMPHVLEVATSLLSHYARSGGARLYAQNDADDWIYTRCLENEKEDIALGEATSVYVGYFESAGLHIDEYSYYDYIHGVSCCRMLLES